LNIGSQTSLPPVPSSVPAVTPGLAGSAQAAAPQPETVSAPSTEAIAAAAQDVIAAAEAAMAKSVSAALVAVAASQNSLASLMADLVQAQQVPSLPAPVLAAIAQVLTLRTPADAELTAGDIKAALTDSGLFPESNADTERRAATAGTPTPLSGADIKNAVLVLRQVLTAWLSSPTPSAADAAQKASQPPTSTPQPPPRYNGSSAGGPNPPPLGSAAPALAPSTAPLAVDPQAGVKDAPADAPRAQTQIPASPEPPMADVPALTAQEPGAERVGIAVADPGPKLLSTQTQPLTVPNPSQAARLESAVRLPEPAATALASDTGDAPEPPRPSSPALNTPASPMRVPPSGPPLVASPPQATFGEAPNPVLAANAAAFAPMEPQGQSESSPKPVIQTPQSALQTAGGNTQSPATAPAAPQATAATQTQASATGADIKSALLLLQQDPKPSLTNPPAQPYTRTATTNAAPESSRPATDGAPPPYRGPTAAPAVPQRVLAPSLPPDATPRAIGEILAKRTDAVLSHMKLLQIASLPEAPQSSQAATNPNSGPRWMFEMPFATPQGSMVAHFQIDRDAKGGSGEQSGPVWRARFSLDVEPIGPVHAQVALVGERAWVTLWAEREDGVQTLRAKEALLSQSLQDSDFVAEIAFCLGAPRRRIAVAGQLVDSSS
jgi:hypothetical protein